RQFGADLTHEQFQFKAADLGKRTYRAGIREVREVPQFDLCFVFHRVLLCQEGVAWWIEAVTKCVSHCKNRMCPWQEVWCFLRAGNGSSHRHICRGDPTGCFVRVFCEAAD